MKNIYVSPVPPSTYWSPVPGIQGNNSRSGCKRISIDLLSTDAYSTCPMWLILSEFQTFCPQSERKRYFYSMDNLFHLVTVESRRMKLRIFSSLSLDVKEHRPLCRCCGFNFNVPVLGNFCKIDLWDGKMRQIGDIFTMSTLIPLFLRCIVELVVISKLARARSGQ